MDYLSLHLPLMFTFIGEIPLWHGFHFFWTLPIEIRRGLIGKSPLLGCVQYAGYFNLTTGNKHYFYWSSTSHHVISLNFFHQVVLTAIVPSGAGEHICMMHDRFFESRGNPATDPIILWYACNDEL